jgi:glucose/mannose-6-phosphate isomerase
VRGSALPAYVSGPESLVIVSSESGNTEEALACFEDAAGKSATLAAITTGGRLAELARERGATLLNFPEVLQPRLGVFYVLKILTAVLEKTGGAEGSVLELERAVPGLETTRSEWLPDVPTEHNYAKQIANQILGKTAVIYGSPLLGPVAYKWKISLNETSKNLAWSNEFSELDHNEIAGWTSHPIEKVFAVINLISPLDGEHMSKRIEITNRLLSGQMPAPVSVQARGENQIEQLLWATTLGDFVSLYLAVLNNVDPTPVEIIEKLKRQLAE